MKRILSVMLVLCMLVGALAAFSACSSAKVDEKKLTNDPQAVLNTALQNASNKFFTDDANADKVLESAFNKGSLNITFDAGDLAMMLMGIEKISETVYVDASNKEDQKFVSDTTVTVGGEELSAKIFADKTGIAINGEALLGSDKTLAVNLSKLTEKFATSDLATMLDIDEASMAEISEMIAQIKASYEKALAQTEEKVATLNNELLKLMDMAASTETVKIADKDTKCIVASYVINNSTVEKLLDKMVAEAGLTGEEKTEAEAAIDEMIAELNETVTVALTAKVYINQKTNEVAQITLGGTLDPKEEGEKTVTVAATLAFSATEIKLNVDVTGIEEEVAVTVVLGKTEADGKVTYKLTAEAGVGAGSVKVCDLSYTYTKSTGDFVLGGKVMSGEGVAQIDVELKGKITVTDKSAKLEITSVKAMEQEFKFNLSFTATVLDSIPTVPANATDIMDINADGWQEIMVEFYTSPIGQMIFGSMYE